MNFHDRRRGAALTAALILVVTVAGLGAFLIQTQATVARRQAMSIDTRTALYTAEAGLAEAAYQVSQGKSGQVGSMDEPAMFNGNKFWVESEEVSKGEISLTSTGLVGSSRFSVNLRMVPNQNPVARLGVFGDEEVEIKNRVLVDGYDANEGRYYDQLVNVPGVITTGRGGRVGSNGDIVIDDGGGGEDKFGKYVDKTHDEGFSTQSRDWLWGRTDPLHEERYNLGVSGQFPDYTMIAGQAVAGRGGVVISNAGTRIAETLEREKAAVLPDVILPQDLPVRDVGITEITTDVEWEDFSAQAEGFTIRAGARLKLIGPMVLNLGEVKVEKGGRLLIDDKEGPVTLYCRDRFEAKAGSIVSSTDECKMNHGFSILMARPADPDDDKRIKLDCIGDIRGVIYAPGDEIKIKAGFHIYGSVVGKKIKLEDDAWVTVDRALNVGGAGFPALPKKLRWTAVRATDTSVLAAQSSVGKPAKASVPEEVLEVIYMDASDEKATYAGHISGFDPGVAERILSVRWQDPDTLEFSDWMMPAGASPDDLIARWREKLREADQP